MKPHYSNKRRKFPDQRQPNRRQHTAGGRSAPLVDRSPIEEQGSPGPNTLSVAILGCCHGELEIVYDRIRNHEQETGRKVDLLLCCGDFQSLRE